MFLLSRLQNNLNVKRGYHLNVKLRKEGVHDRDLIGITRDRSNSPPRFEQAHKQSKRQRTDPVTIDRNNVDQTLTVIKVTSEYTDKLSTLLLTELSQFKINYI